MRISDWSSDVCSSDLPTDKSKAFASLDNGFGGDMRLSKPSKDAFKKMLTTSTTVATTTDKPQQAASLERVTGLSTANSSMAMQQQKGASEIGRASWRERGGQYE